MSLTGSDKWNAELPQRWREMLARAERAERERDEARAALVAVATELDGREPPAHVMPAGYPDLVIGVQELRRLLTARAERAEAAIQRLRALLLDEFGHSIHDTKRITLRELRAALDDADRAPLP